MLELVHNQYSVGPLSSYLNTKDSGLFCKCNIPFLNIRNQGFYLFFGLVCTHISLCNLWAPESVKILTSKYVSSYYSEICLLEFQSNFILKYLLILRHFWGNNACKIILFSIFTDEIGYGLSQYNAEVLKMKKYEMMSRVRPEENNLKNNIYVKWSKAQNFFLKQYKIRTLKCIVWRLNYTLGPPNLAPPSVPRIC